MSIDEEFENRLFDVSLLSVLESRNECLNKSEVWAILKETCIALKPVEEHAKINNLKLDINCLMIDTSGNIKVEFEQFENKHNTVINGRDKETFVNSIGSVFKYILENHSDVKDNDELFQFVEHMSISSADDRFTIQNIELYSDRQLNGSSVDVLYQDYMNSKRSDDVSSAFQDSFFSSVNSNEESDTDQSICVTRDFDTFSIISDGKSFDNSEEARSFTCLNQLWSHCLDPIFRSNQECLVFIHVILKEMSNILLNEENFKKCLCISKENVFLNSLGQMLLDFSLTSCQNCNEEKTSSKYHDIKYINTIGAMLYDIIVSEHRVCMPDQTVLLLQRMQHSRDMIINDVLHICKNSTSLQTVKSRSVLKCLYNRWYHWFDAHVKYLKKLKHKYLVDVSSRNFIDTLRPTTVKEPITVQQLYQQNPTWINELKFATQLYKPNISSASQILDNTRDNFTSAFRPFPANNTNSLPPPLPNTTRIRATTHFRPLLYTSESSSVHRSQDIALSPLDVTPKYTSIVQSSARMPSIMTMSSSKSWRSMNHLLVNDSSHNNQSDVAESVMLRNNKTSKGNINKYSNTSSLTISTANRSSKVNLIIDIIQAVLETTYLHDGTEVGDRHLLGVADFALSLGRLSKETFMSALKQRFDHIRWTKDSLEELYDIINTKDICTPQSDNKSCDLFTTDYIDSKQVVSTGALNSVPDNTRKSTHSGSKCSGSSSSTTENSESFEEIERKCAAEVSKDINELDVLERPIKTIQVQMREKIDHQQSPMTKVVSNFDECSDISDYPRRKTAPVLPNKLKSSFSFLSPEDTLFYQQIYPVTLMCFSSTLMYANQTSSYQNDQMVNANKIQELILSFQEKNKTIRFKFKELSKTIALISRYDDNKNDKKIKKQFLMDHNELQLEIESLILEEMRLENTIVEYHSLSLETILEELKSRKVIQPIVFSNDVKVFQNLQFIHPACLVACLFAKGAVSSGLMYEFFLVYREFYKPHDFIECLKTTFINIERTPKIGSPGITKARLRLLYIILCWIEGFFEIDISPQIMVLIKDLVQTKLVSHIKKASQLIDKTAMKARGSKTALSLQFTALNTKVNLSAEIIHNVDILKTISGLDKSEKDKEKVNFRSILYFSKGNNLGNQDTFSILNISPKDLAVCLTLIQQTYFNAIHPCHLLLYLRSLSGNEESILNSINNDRFPARTSLVEGTYHREIRAFLLLSGQLTHWSISEIFLMTDPKLQSKIVKKLVKTCNWCKELNNFATMTSIVEALTSDKLKWAPFWTHVSAKVTKTLKDITACNNKLFNSSSSWPDGHNTSSNAILSGVAFLPCLHAILVHLKMSSFGNCMNREGSLKWMKLRKLSKILDQIRLYKQFRYVSSDAAINELRSKLKYRIDHLTSISLDILQSHNIMLTQTS